MKAGAEFVLVHIDKEGDEPVELDGLVLLRNTRDTTISAKVISVGIDIIANVKKGDQVWFNKHMAQLVEDEMYAVPEAAILAFK